MKTFSFSHTFYNKKERMINKFFKNSVDMDYLRLCNLTKNIKTSCNTEHYVINYNSINKLPVRLLKKVIKLYPEWKKGEDKKDKEHREEYQKLCKVKAGEGPFIEAQNYSAWFLSLRNVCFKGLSFNTRKYDLMFEECKTIISGEKKDLSIEKIGGR